MFTHKYFLFTFVKNGKNKRYFKEPFYNIFFCLLEQSKYSIKNLTKQSTQKYFKHYQHFVTK